MKISSNYYLGQLGRDLTIKYSLIEFCLLIAMVSMSLSVGLDLSSTLAQSSGVTVASNNSPTNGVDALSMAANLTRIPSPLTDFEDKRNVSGHNFNPISVDILADRKEYTEFEDIAIMVNLYGIPGNVVKLILEERDSSNLLVHRSSQTVNVDNYIFYLHPSKIGDYTVIVSVLQGNNIETATTSFKVVSIFHTNMAKFIYLTGGFFIALMVLLMLGINNNLLEEILRFVFLSGIVVSILASLLFSDLQFGTQSPVGLITFIDENKEKQWVFSIGNALKIPIFVVVFGLIGGYIRYLYKTSMLINTEKQGNTNKSKTKTDGTAMELSDSSGSKTEMTRKQRRRETFYESLHDIMLFLLAPLLAIAVYFLLFAFGLSGANAIYTLAAISFGVGLTTEEVIQRLTNFVNDTLAHSNKSKEET